MERLVLRPGCFTPTEGPAARIGYEAGWDLEPVVASKINIVPLTGTERRSLHAPCDVAVNTILRNEPVQNTVQWLLASVLNRLVFIPLTRFDGYLFARPIPVSAQIKACTFAIGVCVSAF